MKVDMSSAAVTRRLNDLNQLWKLCVTLGSARRIANVDSERKAVQQEPLNPKSRVSK